MYLQEIVEVAVGLIFSWLLLSIAVLQVQEIIANILAKRSSDLERIIREILDDPEMVEKFYKHPLIKSLSKPKELSDNEKEELKKLEDKAYLDLKWFERRKLARLRQRPSYIPSSNFTSAIFDIVSKAGPINKRGKNFIKQLRSGAKALSENSKNGKSKLGESIESLLFGVEEYVTKAESELAAGHKKVEEWFDSSMDRLNGWYKRWSQKIAFIIGLILAISLNIDSIHIAQVLWRNPAARQESAAYVQTYMEKMAEDSVPLDTTDLQNIKKEIQEVNYPIGWGQVNIEDNTNIWQFWFIKVFGWLITAGAAMQGAPFWFDTLKKLVNVRSSGVNPAEKTKEGATT